MSVIFGSLIDHKVIPRVFNTPKGPWHTGGRRVLRWRMSALAGCRESFLV